MHRSLWRNTLILERATANRLPVLHQDGNRTVDWLAGRAMDHLERTAHDD